MRYRNDFMDKMQTGVPQQYMPVTCGAYNGGMPSPMNQGSYPSQMFGTPAMGAQQPLQPLQLMQPLPTGFPTGGTTSPLLPTTGGPPSTVAVPGIPAETQAPLTVQSTMFTPGFLRTQIGRRMRIEFLIGTNGTTDRSGTLVAVGASYIIIRLIDSDDLMMCDIYSIKFVTLFV